MMTLCARMPVSSWIEGLFAKGATRCAHLESRVHGERCRLRLFLYICPNHAIAGSLEFHLSASRISASPVEMCICMRAACAKLPNEVLVAALELAGVVQEAG